MNPDTSLFGQIRNFIDYDKAEQEFQLRKQALQNKVNGQDPAALKLANEYLTAVQSGDTARANAIREFAKTQDKGLGLTGFQDGQPVFGTLPGYAQSVGSIEGTKAGYKQQAEKNVDLQMNPRIKQAEEQSKQVGKASGEKEALLNSMEAKLPQLYMATSKLSELGKKATYTLAGQGYDFARRQFGAEPREGAIARAEYISRVDNEILPLLRDTFGAAFTQKEGESLKATLGDPDMAPKEKDAVLKSFIETKIQNIKSTQRELGRAEITPDNTTPAPQIKFLGFE